MSRWRKLNTRGADDRLLDDTGLAGGSNQAPQPAVVFLAKQAGIMSFVDGGQNRNPGRPGWLALSAAGHPGRAV